MLAGKICIVYHICSFVSGMHHYDCAAPNVRSPRLEISLVARHAYAGWAGGLAPDARYSPDDIPSARFEIGVFLLLDGYIWVGQKQQKLLV